jgi:hypothetical protein
MRSIASAVREEHEDMQQKTFSAQVNDPVLGTALQTIAFLLLGIVFLMTNKPSFSGAILTIAIALLTGLASGIPLWWGASGRMKTGGKGILS